MGFPGVDDVEIGLALDAVDFLEGVGGSGIGCLLQPDPADVPPGLMTSISFDLECDRLDA